MYIYIEYIYIYRIYIYIYIYIEYRIYIYRILYIYYIYCMIWRTVSLSQVLFGLPTFSHLTTNPGVDRGSVKSIN